MRVFGGEAAFSIGGPGMVAPESGIEECAGAGGAPEPAATGCCGVGSDKVETDGYCVGGNGGGTAANNDANAATPPAALQFAMPCVHTSVSRVKRPD